jgi:NAD(P)-dependent dehydrogenase (short-subunit alcohol dehydrogenase family)
MLRSDERLAATWEKRYVRKLRMAFDLSGHRVLITGSTQGVGRAIALACARAGADVVLHGLARDERARETERECAAVGRQVALVTGDLSESTEVAVDRLYHEACELMPGIDLLVNNAGMCADVPFLEMSWALFERTMRLNVYAYFFLTQRFARQWVEQHVAGRVLMVGSINGRLAEPAHSAYDTSKGAVEMMVRTLCVELAPHDVRVNGIAPGLFRTPLTSAALDDATFLAWMQRHTPNGQVPGPEVAGEAAVFLLSDAASHIHGQMLLIDGGMSAWQQPNVQTQKELDGGHTG